MTKLSAEERRAVRAREDAEREAQQKLDAEAFRLSLPHLLLTLAARIRPFGEAIVVPNDGSYRVEYRFYDLPMENVSLGLDTEEWGVDSLRSTIEGCELAAKIRAEKVQLAREGWASLTPAQQRAMIDLGVARQP